MPKVVQRIFCKEIQYIGKLVLRLNIAKAALAWLAQAACESQTGLKFHNSLISMSENIARLTSKVLLRELMCD